MTTEVNNHKEALLASQDVIDIFRICIQAQNDGKCTAFFDLSGHCECLTVRLFAPCWISNMDPTFNDYVYIGRDSAKYVSEFKQRIISYLNGL